MDVAAIRPPAPHRPRPSGPRAPGTHATRPAHPAHPAAPAPPSAEELALLAKQAQFDMFVQAQAESEREANALRDLAMEQLKHDDQAMHAWIKLI